MDPLRPQTTSHLGAPINTHAGDVRRFAVKASLVLITLLVVPLVSRVGDAGNVFHSQEYVSRIAEKLRSGYNVTGVGDFDERLLQSEIVRDLNIAPELVVLGSSRAMTLSSKLLGRPLTNTAMSGASIDDLFAAYQFYRRRGFRPRTILLCLDPWMLNEHYDDRRWRSVAVDAKAMRQTLGVGPSPVHGLFGDLRSRLADQLLSPDYFKASLQQLIPRARHQDAMRATHESVNAEMTRLTDGAITYGVSYRDRSPAVALTDAKEYLATDPIYGLREFTSITPRRRAEMLRFLKLLRTDGVDVRVVLIPYHPLVYQELAHSRRYVPVDDVERAVRGIAAEAGTRVAGSYSPIAIGLSPADFFDAMHPRDAPTGVIAMKALSARN